MSVHIPTQPVIRQSTSMMWELKGALKAEELILPCGIVEMVFNLSAPISAVLPGNKNIDRVPNCFIQGVHTDVIQVNYAGRHHLFGIRLWPQVLRDLLGCMPAELQNEAIDLTLIKKQFESLWNQLIEADDFQSRVAIVENFFQPVTLSQCDRSTFLSQWFLQPRKMVIDHEALMIQGSISPTVDTVDTLADQVCYSTRHLNRKSQELFGLTAEELVRYKKFLQAINLIHFKPRSLTDVAHRAGFYDQSHFIRVFRSYAGMTPKQYQLQKSEIPFHLFG